LALINEYRKGVIDYPSFNAENKEHNCTTAFKISEEQLNIPSLIDPVEMAAGKTSDKNVVLYLSLWFNAFKELNAGVSKDDLARRIAELEEKIRLLTLENEELRRRRAELFASQNNLTEKLQLLSSEEETLFSARDEVMTQLKELQDKYDLEKMTMEEQIKLLKEQISMSSAGSEDQQIQLKSKIAEVEQDRDRLLEELRKLKEGMKKENEEIAEKNAQLKKRLEQEKKDREALEQHLSKIQEEQGAAVIDLHKHLAKHVVEMNTWKDFLEQDKEYDSVDLHITMADELRKESFDQKVDIIDGAFSEETTLLAKLLNDRNGGKSGERATTFQTAEPSSPRKKKTTKK
jgi:chromosome segregation ATPase